MANILQKYFPMIRTREAVLNEITGNDRLMAACQDWNSRNCFWLTIAGREEESDRMPSSKKFRRFVIRLP